MDPAAKPGDDFYRYANGRWLDKARIDSDSVGSTRFTVAGKSASERTSQIIADAASSESTPNSVAWKIGVTYASFMNTAAVEAAGSAPLQPYLTAIMKISNPAELATAMAAAGRRGVGSPFDVFTQQDLKNSSVNVVNVRQGELGMPDRDYYLSSDPKMVILREKYRSYVVSLLTLAGWKEPKEAAERVLQIESALAQAWWDGPSTRDVDKIYNPRTENEFEQTVTGFEWKSFAAAAGIDNRSLILAWEPSALSAAAKLTSSMPLQAWKDYLAFRTVAAAAPYLSDAFVRADFDFNDHALQGISTLPSRRQQGESLVNSSLGQAVGQLYVERYFPPAAKAQIDEMVRNLTAAMDARLSRVVWMSPATKKLAHMKLSRMLPEIGYPATWRDYTGLQVIRDDVVGNEFRAREFEYNRGLARLDHPVDRGEWSMTPQMTNAYASVPANNLVFPAGILQPPYFDPGADPALNYGAIGVVIGHEISHNFDDRGSRFDPEGKLATWWTPEDVRRFNELTGKMVEQYDGYEALAGLHVNGKLTLSENIADLGGMHIALDAYHASLHGKTAPIIDGLTGDQRFFLSYAQANRSKIRDELTRLYVQTDPHSPAQFRVATMRNIDEWYAAFDVKPGQREYLPPSSRISIW